jgi:geranylgeranyl reductase family protein
MQYDVAIVGGGPAGCTVAKHIAKANHRVLVIEDHDTIGEPVRCSGLVSPRTMEIAGISDRIIINQFKDARVYSPLGGQISIKSDRVKAVAVDRASFDREIAVHAREAGADIILGTRAKGIERTTSGYRINVEKNSHSFYIDARLLIGADGVNSLVAKWLGLKRKMPVARMYAADVELERTDINNVDIFLGQSLAPGWFGWVIPLDRKTCRVGTGYTCQNDVLNNKNQSPRYYFHQMVKQYPNYFKGLKILHYTGGSVPFGMTPKIYAANAMLVGDAAIQTKPISGGGIYFGLIGAELCSKVADQALNKDNLSESALSKYQKMWKKRTEGEIRCCTGYREAYESFRDEDIDSLLRFLEHPYWQGLIARYGDIDYPSWIARHLAFATPWIQKFVKACWLFKNNKNDIKRYLYS